MQSANLQKVHVLHLEHKVWMNELVFYADEISIFERQLEKLVMRNIKDMLPNLEKFQNNFIRQKEVLDELQHDIKIREQSLAKNISKGIETVQTDDQLGHNEIRGKMEVFKKIFTELRKNFLLFLRRWYWG